MPPLPEDMQNEPDVWTPSQATGQNLAASPAHPSDRGLAWYMIGWALHREMLLAGIRACKSASKKKVSKEAVALAPLLHRCVQPADQPLDVDQQPGAAYLLARQEFGNLVIATPRMADAYAMAQDNLMSLLTPAPHWVFWLIILYGFSFGHNFLPLNIQKPTDTVIESP